MVLTADELEARRELLASAPDLSTLSDRLRQRALRVLERQPAIPALKGMLTADGGICPEDRIPLVFDPWSPSRHRCIRCGREYAGERHDRRWAWHQHLWLAERIAEAASVGLTAGEDPLVAWAVGRVTEYGERYLDYPNADNVLGPSRLFSSTYLESIWLTGYLAAAFMLREVNALDEASVEAVSRVAEEAANLIGEFDEGLSNRQTWHNAALAAAAVWFGDEDLIERAVHGPRGLVGHLVDGFRDDGLWYEGENYHLFALRGMLTGLGWARLADLDFFADEQSRARLVAALRAPTLTALPDGAFPARKDSRFGVSLAQPMYLELWEAGVASLLNAGEEEAAAELGDWLHRLYAMPAQPAETFDSYLHEAGEPAPERRSRHDLSWWMLGVMVPELPGSAEGWKPRSVLLDAQGLAILRGERHYTSLECGLYGGGHGHPDRLHLTLHADGVHWLADPGTGSYVSRDLFWYRSTLAHNAPRVDGAPQPPEDASCDRFDVQGSWGWARGRFGQLTRTVVAGPDHLVDVTEFAADEAHLVELAWHPAGELEILTPGRWEPAELADEFVTGAERFVPDGGDCIRVRATRGEQALDLVFDTGGDLLRARGPGRPGEPGQRPFLLRRATGRYVRFVTVARWSGPAISGVRFAASEFVLDTEAGPVAHRQISDGWEVEQAGVRTVLRGFRRGGLGLVVDVSVRPEALAASPPVATAHHLPDPPALDGTTGGFVTDGPILLDHEDQYRRSEEPYPGEEGFSARAWLGWDEAALYLAVDVTHPDPVFPHPDAPPLRLDNEPDLIHADGLQLYLRLPDATLHGWLVVPDPTGTGLRVRAVAETRAQPGQVRGAWRRTDGGYTVTLALSLPGWPPAKTDGPLGFDLLVNEMRPDRQRRMGQLVWTGGAGWIYLWGDRQNPARLGRLELA
jgi:hypothetical protein